MPSVTPVQIGKFKCGDVDNPLTVIAGPCVIESRDLTLRIAESLKNVCEQLCLPLVFKASFDKANRTSAGSARGVGLAKGVEILAEVREFLGCPTITDVHETPRAVVLP